MCSVQHTDFVTIIICNYRTLGAVHRYYESRRRIGIEELPDRQEKAAEQKKRRKYRARQQRVTILALINA